MPTIEEEIAGIVDLQRQVREREAAPPKAAKPKKAARETSRAERIVADVGNEPSAPPAAPRGQTPGQRFMAPVEEAAGPYSGGVKVATRPAAFILDHLPSFVSAVASTGATALAAPIMGLAAPSAGVAAAPFGAMAGKALQTRMLGGRAATGEELVGVAQTEFGSEAVGGVGGGALIRGLAVPGRRLLRAWGGRLVPEAAEMQRVVRDAGADFEADLIIEGYGPDVARRVADQGILPAEVTKGRMLDVVDNFLGGSAVTGSSRGEFLSYRKRALELAAVARVRELGPRWAPQRIARELGTTVKRSRDAARYEPKVLENVVAQRLRVEEIPVRQLGLAGAGAEAGLAVPGATKLVVAETGNEIGLVDTEHLKRTILPRVAPGLPANVVADIENLPDRASFAAVKQVRSALGQAITKTVGPNKNETFEHFSGLLYDGLTKEMDTATLAFDRAMRRKHGGQHVSVTGMHHLGNQAYKETTDEYNEVYLNKLMRFAAEDPRMAQTGLSLLKEVSGPGNEQMLGRLREMAGENSDTWRAFRRLTGAGVIGKSWKKEGLSGSAMVNNLRGQLELEDGAGIGAEELRSILGGAEYGRLLRAGRVIEQLQKKNPAPGRMVAQLGETGVFINAASGGVGKAAGTAVRYMVTMAGMSKLLTSPAHTELLLRGARLGVGTRESVATAARILQHLVRDQDFIEYADKMPADEYRSIRQQMRKVQ